MKPTKEYLIQEYAIKKRSMKKIGKKLNRSPQTVMRWIHEYKIKINKYPLAWNSRKTYKEDPRILAKERHPRFKNTKYYNSDFKLLRKKILPCKCNRCFNEATLLHHKDKDKMNNELSNLEPLCPSCHSIHHNHERGLFEYKHKCDWCEKEFKIFGNKKCNQKFCSLSCKSKYYYHKSGKSNLKIRNKLGKTTHSKICKFCKKTFITNKIKQQFCCYSCSATFRHL